MTPQSSTRPIAESRVVGVFAKKPEAGCVKTRLAEAANASWAAQVAMAFLRDTLQRLKPISARRVLAYAPAEALAFFTEIAGDCFAFRPQATGDLGQRMHAFFTEEFEAGAKPVVLVGTDSPTLPPLFIEQAFQALQRADVVLGPATDGGYYLIGCRGVPPVFDWIPWSTSQVLRETVARLTQRQLSLELLPPWYDVDTLDDWQMLKGHVAALRRAGLDPGVPHTERLFDSFEP
jgi:rSAM/selenodomain-associated transferase 1